MSSRLLEKISYCSRRPSKAKDIYDNDIDVVDVFPFNPESKTSPATAKSWARCEYPRGAPGSWEPPIVTLDNVPFEVTITSLDVRSEGGRAYKVIDDKHNRFDLREDQIIEVLKTCGIKPGGKISGKFVWGVMGSQVRLAFVGGLLHLEMVESLNELKKQELAKKMGTALTPAKLVTGRVYKKRDGSCYAFLGYVVPPGKKETHCAVIELPTKINSTVDNWDSLTWNERFDTCPYSNDEIQIIKAPTFVSEIGSFDVASYRENVDGTLRYTGSYYGSYAELSERHFDVPHLPPSRAMSYDAWHKLEKLAQLERRLKYRDLLVWKD